jgi:hypothetical protein
LLNSEIFLLEGSDFYRELIDKYFNVATFTTLPPPREVLNYLGILIFASIIVAYLIFIILFHCIQKRRKKGKIKGFAFPLDEAVSASK